MKLNGYGNKLLRQAEGMGGGAPAEPVIVPEAPTGPDLSFIPETFHKDGSPDLTAFTAHYQELVADHAKRTPPPETYDYALPADLTYDGLDLPEGFKVEIDAETYKPIFDDLSGFLKGIGAPAEAAPELTKMLARYEATRFARDFAAMREDSKLLGTPDQGKARLETVVRKLETLLPADQAEAVLSLTKSSKALMALEKLMAPQGMGAPVVQPPTRTPEDDLRAYYATKTK